MQCTFCSGESRARCASNHVVAPPFLAARRHRTCAPASTHAPRTRSQHGRMRTPRTRSLLPLFFLSLVSFVPHTCVAAHFYRRELFFSPLSLTWRDLDSDEFRSDTEPFTVPSVRQFISRVREPLARRRLDNFYRSVSSRRNAISSERETRGAMSRRLVRRDVTRGRTWQSEQRETRTTTRQTSAGTRKRNTERNEAKEGKNTHTHATTDEKPSIRWSIWGAAGLNGCRRYELPSSRGPRGSLCLSCISTGTRVGREELHGLRDRAFGKRHGKIYRNPMRGKCADICESGGGGGGTVRKPLEENRREESTKNKGPSRRPSDVCVCVPQQGCD